MASSLANHSAAAKSGNEPAHLAGLSHIKANTKADWESIGQPSLVAGLQLEEPHNALRFERDNDIS